MNLRDRVKLARILRHAANLMSLPAHPALWPDWMTLTKRSDMSMRFLSYANEVEPKSVNNPPKS